MKVKILYNHPNPLVMARNPRILDYTPKGQDTEYYEPIEEQIEVDGQKVKCITYTVNEQFGRSLLSSQPERYFLLEPSSLFIKRFMDNKLGSTTVKVHSILNTGFNTVGVEVFEKEQAPNGPEPIDLIKPIETQTAKEAVEFHHENNFQLQEDDGIEEEKPKGRTPRAPRNPLVRPDL